MTTTSILGAGASPAGLPPATLDAYRRSPRWRPLEYVFWCLPVGLLRVLAIRFRGWVARRPLLDAVWRCRFIIGIAAIVQNAQEGAWQLGLIPAGIIAASYLLPWLRHVHARRVRASGRVPGRRVRARVTRDGPSRSGDGQPLQGVLR